MIAPARTAAYQALHALEVTSADLPSVLVRARAGLDDERDRALAAEIVAGTVRWQRALDHIVEGLSSRPLHRIETEVRLILRLSLYQLLHLDRVPASAVVDDAVDLARAARKPGATTFVNALLRNAVRTRHQLPLPPRPHDASDESAALAYLGVTHSHPDWLVARWLARYGFEGAERWVRFNNETPRLTLRANRLRVTVDALRASLEADDIETEPTTFAPDGLAVVSGNPLRRPLDGSFVVQDEASQIVTHAVAARPGEHVLDLCAAPGGKTTALAAAMEDRGILVASDVRPRRVKLLAETLRIVGTVCARPVHVSADGALPFAAAFDRVLVDAPCSGLGTVRRDPDIRWRRHAADLPLLAGRQVTLLSRAADVVRAGGRLVYATCSSEPEENEEVVERFLTAAGSFELVPLSSELPERLRALVDADGMIRTRPDRHGLEGFFAAALVRRR